ncbi:MAG: type II secretion system protein GspG [Phycisphaerales bacterium]
MTHHPRQTVVIHRAPSNGLGVAGFVISLLGLLMCGLIAPLGMLLSFIAMFKKPNGLAIAGFIIGLIGSVWILVLVVLVGIMGMAVVGAGVAGALGMSSLEVAIDQAMIAQQVDAYRQNNGHVPSTLGILGLDQETLDDPWGKPYRYAPDATGDGYSLSSDGPDGVEGTADDITYGG